MRGGTLLVSAALCGVVCCVVGYSLLSSWALGSNGHHSSGLDPLVFSLLRDAFAWPLLQTAALCSDGPRRPAWRDVPRLACLGLSGMFANQYL